MAGGEIEVLSGLRSGDQIVVAGAAYLAEGMPVTLLPATEQAEPRVDE
jgi:multidrug efflux pump subunit AcrA (membrane-fusion protein)